MPPPPPPPPVCDMDMGCACMPLYPRGFIAARRGEARRGEAIGDWEEGRIGLVGVEGKGKERRALTWTHARARHLSQVVQVLAGRHAPPDVSLRVSVRAHPQPHSQSGEPAGGGGGRAAEARLVGLHAGRERRLTRLRLRHLLVVGRRHLLVLGLVLVLVMLQVLVLVMVTGGQLLLVARGVTKVAMGPLG